MTELRVAERTRLDILSAPTVTRDVVVAKSIAEQYSEVINAPHEFRNAAHAPIDAVQAAPKELTVAHPNLLVRRAGTVTIGAATALTAAGAALLESVVPTMGLVVGSGIALFSGFLASLSVSERADDKRSKFREDAAVQNRKQLEQAVPSAVELTVREELARVASPGRAIVIGVEAERLLAESHTSQPLLAKADVREAFKALIARGDDQSSGDVERVARFVALQRTIASTPNTARYAIDVFAAFNALTPDEQRGLADMLHSTLFAEDGPISKTPSNAPQARGVAREFAGVLLDARIAGAKANAPSEPTEPANAERLIAQTLQLADLLAAAQGSTFVSTGKADARISAVEHLELALSLASAPWLTPDESAAFTSVIATFKAGCSEAKCDPTSLAFLNALTVLDPNDAPEATTAASALLDLLSHKSWGDVKPKLDTVSPELRVLIADTATRRLFDGDKLNKHSGAADVHVGLQRILRRKA